MARHAKRYTLMPIPPIESHTTYFDAGRLRIGVEFRVLTNDIVNKHMDTQDTRIDLPEGIDDGGVSLHVFGPGPDGKQWEHLRFDCFDEDPHYHYVDWAGKTNDIVQIDPVADGDPLAWSLDRIRDRLPQMLERAGVEDARSKVDPAALEAVLPRVSEAAYRARYHHDSDATLAGALA